MKYLIVSILIVLFKFQFTKCANILGIFALPGYSHNLVQIKIIKQLLENGHTITILSTSHMDIKHENFTLYDLEHTNKYFLPMLRIKELYVTDPEWINNNEKKKDFYLAKAQLENKYFQYFLDNSDENHFDLIIVECYLCPYFIMAEVYDCPIVFSYGGEPSNFFHSLWGNSMHPRTGTFSERSKYFFSHLRDENVENVDYINQVDSVIAAAYPNRKFPNFVDIVRKRIKIVHSFTNLATTTTVNSYLPFYHNVGSIHLEKPKMLNDKHEYTELLDNSQNGTIIMSLGSYANELPDDIFMKFAKAFGQLPYDVIWKTNPSKYKHLDIPDNILIQKWLPLPDVLAHPNVKLLIAHGGMRSIEEAIDREVPMIICPLAYDQPFNGYWMWKQKIGTSLDVLNFDSNYLVEVIYEVMKKEYRRNIRKAHKLVTDKISTSLETAVNNIELLIKYDQTYNFHPYVANDVSFCVRYHCDVHVIIFVLFAAAVFFIKNLITFILKSRKFKGTKLKFVKFTQYKTLEMMIWKNL